MEAKRFLYCLYTQTTRAKQPVQNPFSESFCARKMCHLLLAGYEYVLSFLNQWKQNDSYIIYIHKQRSLSNRLRILVVKAIVINVIRPTGIRRSLQSCCDLGRAERQEDSQTSI